MAMGEDYGKEEEEEEELDMRTAWKKAAEDDVGKKKKASLLDISVVDADLATRVSSR